MVPDLLINSLISRLIYAYTALRLSILSSLKAVQCSLMLCSSFCVSLSLPLFPLSLHSSLSKTLVSGLFFFPWREWSSLSRCIPDTIKYYTTGIGKLSLLQAPTRKSLCLAAGSCLNIQGHRSVCKMPLLFFSLFVFFFLKRDDALSLNRLQMELNLEPFKGWIEGGLSEGDL